MRLLPLLLLLLAAPAAAQMQGSGAGGGHGGGTPGGSGQGDPRAAPEPPAGSERPTVMVEPVGMLIATFDANFDGKVTRAELAAGVKRTFDSIDTAGTGRLGYIEYADWSERFLGNRTALPSPFEVDRNADNTITLDELEAAIAHRFDEFDADRDGVVTRAELLTIHDVPGGGERRSSEGRRSGGGGRGGGHRGGGGGMGGGVMGGGGMGGGGGFGG